MENLPALAPEADPAAQAFARLGEKVDLLEAAIAGLAAKRDAAPDYSETLGEIAALQERMRDAINTLARKPAMEFTPEDWAQRIDNAALQARRTDHAELHASCNRFDHASRELKSVVASAHTAHEQRRRLLWAAIGGLLAGILLWAVFPGAFVRALPQSWLIPEGMAARVLREKTLWEAGSRLMQADSPSAWAALNQAAVMLRDNRAAIEKCHEMAERMKKATRCAIKISPIS